MNEQVKFGNQLLGYDKSQVRRKLGLLEREVAEAHEELDAVQTRLMRAEQERDELKGTLAAMRRQQVQMMGQTLDVQPFIIVVGPTDSLGWITWLIEALEGSRHLTIGFRVFRDGFYRIDGLCHDRDQFVAWLKARSDVRQVTVDGETLHVVPQGVPA